jgi:hypothetical protein
VLFPPQGEEKKSQVEVQRHVRGSVAAALRDSSGQGLSQPFRDLDFSELFTKVNAVGEDVSLHVSHTHRIAKSEPEGPKEA